VSLDVQVELSPVGQNKPGGVSAAWGFWTYGTPPPVRDRRQGMQPVR